MNNSIDISSEKTIEVGKSDDKFSYFDTKDQIEKALSLFFLSNTTNLTEGKVKNININNIDILDSISKKLLYYIEFFVNDTLHKELRGYTEWFEEEKINYIVCRLNKFMENTRFFIKNNILHKFEGNNSLLGILGSGPINFISLIGLYKEGRTDKDDLINELDTFRENFLKLLSYMDVLCKDSKKLELALLFQEGYIYIYRHYFLKTHNKNGLEEYLIPRGFDKLNFIFFFHQYEQGNIGYKNLEEHLEKIKNDGFDVDKIREDFPNLKIGL